MNRFLAKALLAATALCATGIQPALASPDYPPAIWNPAPTCNYTAGRSTPFTHVAIHTTQGSYAGAISWFKNCSASVSAHYVLRSSDGQITQMVREGDRAWHIGSSNGYTVGIEHEGYIANPTAWYTTAMYNASAALTRDILAARSLPSKVYDGSLGWNAKLPDANYNVKGHINYANQTHTDPGSGWDWRRYKTLVDGTPTTTPSKPLPGTIVGYKDLCVDINGGATADGSEVQLWTCNSTKAQQWYLSNWRDIRNPLAAKCMVVGNGGAIADGSPIEEWTCNGGAGQKWWFKNMNIVGGNSGKCVDVPGGNLVSGQALQLHDCNTSDAQKFTFDPPTGTIKTVNNLCVDVSGGSSANGNAVQLWTCNGTPAQQWIPGNGGFRTALNTNSCLDINGNGTANGTKVQVWGCIADNTAQQFGLRGQLETTLGKCLDIPAGNGVSGQSLQLWSCAGNIAQRWTLWQPR
ncbi:ricin-type beta-trefoil lectin domain protein [Janthinobacterium sp. 17J80-10]|uniref:ricin-type beta-trefoil lectin domain protein n=1 Tax=Janthinobacterium sp. 17J80-10 TaxID=2497863 RepID=UPI0019D6C407|nr:ricin-type beta-trefoil lectin domain protein [Janthinobacterium sp. 17J80-10]